MPHQHQSNLQKNNALSFWYTLLLSHLINSVISMHANITFVVVNINYTYCRAIAIQMFSYMNCYLLFFILALTTYNTFDAKEAVSKGTELAQLYDILTIMA